MDKAVSDEKEHNATSAMAAQTSSIHTSVRADGGGSVIAPSLIGSNFSAPVTFNFNTTTTDVGKEPSSEWDDARKQALQDKLKLFTKRQCSVIYEGTSDGGSNIALADVYTELYIVEGITGGVSPTHEVWQIEAMSRTVPVDTPVQFSEIFKFNLESQNKRTVLTLGIAGVGKTVTVQKFTLEWAEGKTNQDLDYVFMIPFRDLNPIAGEKYSLYTLLCYFYHKLELSVEEVKNFDSCNVLFVLDGLDESCLKLNFRSNKLVCDVTKMSTVDLLIVNLIVGNMLPSAQIWITSRPAAVHQIAYKYIHVFTEVRGFSDDQKEEYFRKRISNQDKASRIIAHIKKSRSLHIMCHIPLFCWISATVLQQVFNDTDTFCQDGEKEVQENVPTTLSGMYTNFMLYHTDLKFHKYPELYQGVPLTCADYSEEILKLAELAHKNLMKEKFIFFEKDLQECGIDIQVASVYSGIFTEIFKKEKTLFRSKAYSFVHLSIQEFLAALYVVYIFSSKGRNILHQTALDKLKWQVKNTLFDLHKSAVRYSLQSESGHLDLFLRFLLGISLESSQSLLRNIFPQLSLVGELGRTIQFVKEKIRERISPERSINLLHCLNEMKDNSMVEEIKSYMTFRSDHQLAPAECSTLVYLLQMSKDNLDEFDLKKFLKSDEGLRRMIPLVVSSGRALLNQCNLTKQSCQILAGALSSRMSCLTELDLSNNDLRDAGLLLLSQGLQSPHCKLKILKLCECLITEKGFYFLASLLTSNTSHLRSLDLRFNHSGLKAVEKIADIIGDSTHKLENLKADFIGEIQKRTSLLSYKCELTLDPNTAHQSLCLSDGKTTVCWRNEETFCPDHPERFKTWKQVLCSEALSERHYWEAEWRGSVFGVIIGLTYKSISRVGEANECLAGLNDKSWSLRCSNYSYTALHSGTKTDIKRTPEEEFSSERIGVYLDWPAGLLSFYRVSSSSNTLVHIYSFHATFTEPVYPVIRLLHNTVSVSVIKPKQPSVTFNLS